MAHPLPLPARGPRRQQRQSELIGHVATSVHELQEKIRAARSDEITDRDGLDDADSSELDIHDIAVALMQLKTEILKQ